MPDTPSSSASSPAPARSSSHPPRLVLRGTRTEARLEPGHVVVRQGGATHRIPLGAVERVEARPGVVELVLFSASGPATVFAVPHRNRRAAEAFTRALSGALPVADRADRPVDGSALVRTERAEPSKARLLLRALVSWPALLVWGWVAGLVAILLGPGFDRDHAWPVVMWVVNWIALGMAGMVGESSLNTLRGRVLLRRGITVVAEVTGHEIDDSGEESEFHAEYRFVDASGERRRHTARDEEGFVAARTVQICYDPDDPALVRRRDGLGLRLLGAAAALVFVALPSALAGLACVVVPLWTAYACAAAGAR